jgi:beta-glucosidase
MTIKRICRSAIVASLSFMAATCGKGLEPYKDSTKPVETRVMDLLGRMTMEEKVGQLLCPYGWPMYEKDSVNGEKVRESQAFRDFIEKQKGGMLWGLFRADPWTRKTLENGLDPALAAKTYNALQRYAIEHSRLGIPIILAEEAPHGHMAIGTTVFPTGIGMASTWDKELMEAEGRVIAMELRAQGAHIAYGPVMDLAREPRWSRVEETLGEDPYLSGEMAASEVRGLSPLHNGYDKGVAATLKHFIAYGVPEGGHNGNPSSLGERELMETYLPPFRKAIEAGALSVMTSYNAIDGLPSTSNRKLLTELLRDGLRFGGLVVSDLYSIDGLEGSHHVASSPAEAGRMALEAGVDVDLGAKCYAAMLKESGSESVASELDMKALNQAVARVLELKFRMGLFDHPYIDTLLAEKNVRSPENVALALRSARESIVLLKNDGLLPLKKTATVAVIGPNADVMYNQLGDYTAPQDPEAIVTPLEGIIRKIGADKVRYAKGCAIRDPDPSGIAAAVAAAKSADVALVFVGGSSARDFRTKYVDTGAAVATGEFPSDMDAGEGFDRSSLSLLGVQEELLKALKQTGKPMAVVYIQGRPLDMRLSSSEADALLCAWYPGMEGGAALADVLFGDFNPSGRLPVSVPLDVGQLPVYYDKRFPEGGGYVEELSKPLYPFGFGLSYTSFDYSDLKVEVCRDPLSAKVSFKVRNTGAVAGTDVPQVYITDLKASTARPMLQLCGFERVSLDPGEEKTLTLNLGREAFTLYDPSMKEVVEAGDFLIRVGASSSDLRLRETIGIEEGI